MALTDSAQVDTSIDQTAGTSADGGSSALDSFIQKVETQIINPLIILITLAALVVFIWGIVMYIQGAANDEKRKQGQVAMLWSVVGMVIIFGAIAIVNIIKNITGFF